MDMIYSPQSEVPQRVVGEEKPLTPQEALSWNASLSQLLPAQVLAHPRGVFRFKTFEEFNAWKKKHHS
jgi:hypothetical protein